MYSSIILISIWSYKSIYHILIILYRLIVNTSTHNFCQFWYNTSTICWNFHRKHSFKTLIIHILIEKITNIECPSSWKEGMINFNYPLFCFSFDPKYRIKGLLLSSNRRITGGYVRIISANVGGWFRFGLFIRHFEISFISANICILNQHKKFVILSFMGSYCTSLGMFRWLSRQIYTYCLALGIICWFKPN